MVYLQAKHFHKATNNLLKNGIIQKYLLTLLFHLKFIFFPFFPILLSASMSTKPGSIFGLSTGDAGNSGLGLPSKSDPTGIIFFLCPFGVSWEFLVIKEKRTEFSWRLEMIKALRIRAYLESKTKGKSPKEYYSYPFLYKPFEAHSKMTSMSKTMFLCLFDIGWV